MNLLVSTYVANNMENEKAKPLISLLSIPLGSHDTHSSLLLAEYQIPHTISLVSLSYPLLPLYPLFRRNNPRASSPLSQAACPFEPSTLTVAPSKAASSLCREGPLRQIPLFLHLAPKQSYSQLPFPSSTSGQPHKIQMGY